MKISLLLLIFFACNVSYAQDPEFSQISNLATYLNPALAGNDSADVISVKYRNQWPALSGTYVTTGMGYDHYHAKTNGTSYFRIVDDRAGTATLTTDRYSLGYAQKIKLGKKFMLHMGAEITYFTKKIDFDKLTFGDQIDPRRGFVYQTGPSPDFSPVSGIDVSTGLVLSYNKLFVGVSLHHLNEPNESLIGGNSKLPSKFGMQAGYTWEGDRLALSPYVMYRDQAMFQFLQTGINTLIRNKFTVGLGYRWQDAMIFQVGTRFNGFNVLYSYDLTTSKLTNSTAGSHEISAAVRLWKKRPHKDFLMF